MDAKKLVTDPNVIPRDALIAAVDHGIDAMYQNGLTRGASIDRTDVDALREVAKTATQVAIGVPNLKFCGCPLTQAGLWGRACSEAGLAAFWPAFDDWFEDTPVRRVSVVRVEDPRDLITQEDSMPRAALVAAVDHALAAAEEIYPEHAELLRSVARTTPEVAVGAELIQDCGCPLWQAGLWKDRSKCPGLRTFWWSFDMWFVKTPILMESVIRIDD